LNRSLRRVFIGFVTVLSVAVTGAALSWACSPGGEVSASYAGGNGGGGGPTPALSGPAGSDVRVTGRGFTPGRAVQIHWNELAGPVLAETKVAQDGTFEANITIPQAPVDTHTILAASTLSNGAAFARGTPFTVTGPGATTTSGAEANQGPTSQSAPQAPAQSTPGATGGRTNGGSQAAGPNSQTVNAPTVAAPPTGGDPGGTLRRGGSLQQAPLSSDRGTRDKRRTAPGPQGTTPVFADSMPAGGSASPAGSAPPAPTSATSPGADQGGTSERSASGDLWGGFSSASASPPSLDGAAGPADNSSQPMTVGLGLLGLGLVLVVAGFGIAGFRRRRFATHARSR